MWVWVCVHVARARVIYIYIYIEGEGRENKGRYNGSKLARKSKAENPRKVREKEPSISTQERDRHTFLTRASVDVLVTKYECMTLYGWIPLAALKLFKCMQPWSLISGWQERRRQPDCTSSCSSSSADTPDARCCRRFSSRSPNGANATCTIITIFGEWRWL